MGALITSIFPILSPLQYLDDMKLIKKLARDFVDEKMRHEKHCCKHCFEAGFIKAREMAQDRLNAYSMHLYEEDNKNGLQAAMAAVVLAFMGEELTVSSCPSKHSKDLA